MSKESKGRDRQSIEAVRDRPMMFCNGCGYFPVGNDGRHRADCTALKQNGGTL